MSFLLTVTYLHRNPIQPPTTIAIDGHRVIDHVMRLARVLNPWNFN